MSRLIYVRRKIVAAGALTITFVESVTSSGTTLDFTNAIAGDLLVYLDRARSGAVAPTSVTPSMFTLHTAASATDGAQIRYNVSYKIATGSETTVTGMNGDVQNNKIGLIFRGSSAFASVAEGDTDSVAFTNGDPADVAVSASADTPPLIVIAIYTSTGAVSPAGFSTADEDGTITNGTSHVVKYKIHNSSPADVTISMDDEGSFNRLCGFVLELA
jgi:hypothetical protein